MQNPPIGKEMRTDMTDLRKYGLGLLLILLTADCRKPYTPPAIKAANNYLVVDGIINTGVQAVTTVNLNRTRNLGDSATADAPEPGAHVSIVSSTGTSYPLNEFFSNGIYTSNPLSLDNNLQYRIEVVTKDGKKYVSDLVACKPAPAIDSVYWEQPGDLDIYLDSHDPTGNTRYYRWDYTETWEHDAHLESAWGVNNGLAFVVDSTTSKYRCWTSAHSTHVLLGSTVVLSQDRISRAPITSIPNDGDVRLSVRYSILVRQYALTADAYNYWQLIQKTSEGTGTLFDLQPTQLVGNIHSVSDAGEPVIGYVTASTPTQQRLFIDPHQLSGWTRYLFPQYCDTAYTSQNPSDFRIVNYPDTSFTLFYFSGTDIVLSKKFCLDCLYQGGSYTKPSYW
jgi:hypothetical protein